MSKSFSSFLIKRLALALVTIFIIIAITFFAMNAVPGGPFDSEKATSPEFRAALEAKYNLDKPVVEQFFIYIGNLLHGDFGISIKTGMPIADTIWNSFKISAKIGWKSVVWATVIGVALGCIAAANDNTWIDRIIVSISSVVVSVPNFVIASVLMLVFCMTLKWVPAWSPDDPNYILPIISLAVFPASNICRFTKTGMIDVLGQNYIRAARAGGLSEKRVIFKHALKNACIPVITYMGPMITGVLTGSVVVETVFSIGGLGYQFVTGINNRDYFEIGSTNWGADFDDVMGMMEPFYYDSANNWFGLGK